jgi:hypothetical protein
MDPQPIMIASTSTTPFIIIDEEPVENPPIPSKSHPTTTRLTVPLPMSVLIRIENDKFLRGLLKVRYGSVMMNATRTVVSVARSVVLCRLCTTIALYQKYNCTINADYVI